MSCTIATRTSTKVAFWQCSPLEAAMEFDEYAQYRETKLHEQPDFAFNTYLCTIPQDFDRVNPHWHDQMEVVYIKRGEGVVSVDFNRLEVRAGSIVPVLPGEIHSIEGASDGRLGASRRARPTSREDGDRAGRGPTRDQEAARRGWPRSGLRSTPARPPAGGGPSRGWSRGRRRGRGGGARAAPGRCRAGCGCAASGG